MALPHRHNKRFISNS